MKSKTTSHNRTVLRAGYVAIIVNLTLAFFKMIVGSLSHSIAIISDAAHGLIDTLSGIIIIISEKLGNSKRFINSHAKIERYGAILIAIIIICVGIHIITESIEAIASQEVAEYSPPTIIVLISSIITKFILSRYLKNTGEKAKSDTLVASSVETVNDSIISGTVLLAAIIYLIWGINIESYISILVSIIIIKHGLTLIFPKINPQQ